MLFAPVQTFAATGRLFDGATGMPVQLSGFHESSWSNGGFASSPDGFYQLPTKPAGLDTLLIQPRGLDRSTGAIVAPFHDSWYGGAPDRRWAKMFMGGSGDTDIDFVFNLKGEGVIAGRVEDADGHPVWAARVCAFQYVPTLNVWDPVEALAITGPQGEYVIGRLSPGTYRVGTSESLDGDIAVYAGATATIDAAEDIVVPPGGSAGPVVIQLRKVVLPITSPPSVPSPDSHIYVRIHGQLIDATTARAAVGARVEVARFGSQAAADEYGNYTASAYNNAPSTLFSWGMPGYFDACWGSQPLNPERERLWFMTDNGSDTWGCTMVVNRTGSGSLGGVLSDQTGNPLPRRQMQVLQYSPLLDIWDPVEVDVVTDDSGGFSVAALPPGRFRLRAAASAGTLMVHDIHGSDPSQPMEVVLAAGQTVGSLNARILADTADLDMVPPKSVSFPGRPMSLTGSIRCGGPTGPLYPGATVSIQSSSDGASWTQVASAPAPDGRFAIELPAPAAPRWFRAAFAGDSSLAAATGHPILVTSTFEPLPVYRFYNYRKGVHFYTANAAEAQDVRTRLKYTFRDEGVSYSVNTANPMNVTPLYRFYNFRKGAHFYTANAGEAADVRTKLRSTFRDEGEAYRVCSTQVAGATPVYRFYNFKKGVHFYTADAGEAANVRTKLRSTFRDEGTAYYLAP